MKKVWISSDKFISKRRIKQIYLPLIPFVRRIAKANGYAIGVHGTLTRDLDLIAAPWSKRPVLPATLAYRIQRPFQSTPIASNTFAA